MRNDEILERLRNYNFFQKLDLKNEYEDRLERFLIMVGRSQKFQLENDNLEFCFEQINKGYKTLLLDLDEISENKYQKVINYANNNSYELLTTEVESFLR